MKRIKYFR